MPLGLKDDKGKPMGTSQGVPHDPESGATPEVAAAGLIVNFYGASDRHGMDNHQVYKGSIHWDGEKFVCTKGFENYPTEYEDIMIYADGTSVNAKKDSVKWMHALAREFRSPYFWAEKPKVL